MLAFHGSRGFSKLRSGMRLHLDAKARNSEHAGQHKLSYAENFHKDAFLSIQGTLSGQPSASLTLNLGCVFFDPQDAEPKLITVFKVGTSREQR